MHILDKIVRLCQKQNTKIVYAKIDFSITNFGKKPWMLNTSIWNSDVMRKKSNFHKHRIWNRDFNLCFLFFAFLYNFFLFFDILNDGVIREWLNYEYYNYFNHSLIISDSK